MSEEAGVASGLGLGVEAAAVPLESRSVSDVVLPVVPAGRVPTPSSASILSSGEPSPFLGHGDRVPLAHEQSSASGGGPNGPRSDTCITITEPPPVLLSEYNTRCDNFLKEIHDNFASACVRQESLSRPFLCSAKSATGGLNEARLRAAILRNEVLTHTTDGPACTLNRRSLEWHRDIAEGRPLGSMVKLAMPPNIKVSVQGPTGLLRGAHLPAELTQFDVLASSLWFMSNKLTPESGVFLIAASQSLASLPGGLPTLEAMPFLSNIYSGDAYSKDGSINLSTVTSFDFFASMYGGIYNARGRHGSLALAVEGEEDSIAVAYTSLPSIANIPAADVRIDIIVVVPFSRGRVDGQWRVLFEESYVPRCPPAILESVARDTGMSYADYGAGLEVFADGTSRGLNMCYWLCLIAELSDIFLSRGFALPNDDSQHLRLATYLQGLCREYLGYPSVMFMYLWHAIAQAMGSSGLPESFVPFLRSAIALSCVASTAGHDPRIGPVGEIEHSEDWNETMSQARALPGGEQAERSFFQMADLVLGGSCASDGPQDTSSYIAGFRAALCACLTSLSHGNKADLFVISGTSMLFSKLFRIVPFNFSREGPTVHAIPVPSLVPGLLSETVPLALIFKVPESEHFVQGTDLGSCFHGEGGLLPQGALPGASPMSQQVAPAVVVAGTSVHKGPANDQQAVAGPGVANPSLSRAGAPRTLGPNESAFAGLARPQPRAGGHQPPGLSAATGGGAGQGHPPLSSGGEANGPDDGEFTLVSGKRSQKQARKKGKPPATAPAASPGPVVQRQQQPERSVGPAAPTSVPSSSPTIMCTAPACLVDSHVNHQLCPRHLKLAQRQYYGSGTCTACSQLFFSRKGRRDAYCGGCFKAGRHSALAHPPPSVRSGERVPPPPRQQPVPRFAAPVQGVWGKQGPLQPSADSRPPSGPAAPVSVILPAGRAQVGPAPPPAVDLGSQMQAILAAERAVMAEEQRKFLAQILQATQVHTQQVLAQQQEFQRSVVASFTDTISQLRSMHETELKAFGSIVSNALAEVHARISSCLLEGKTRETVCIQCGPAGKELAPASVETTSSPALAHPPLPSAGSSVAPLSVPALVSAPIPAPASSIPVPVATRAVPTTVPARAPVFVPHPLPKPVLEPGLAQAPPPAAVCAPADVPGLALTPSPAPSPATASALGQPLVRAPAQTPVSAGKPTTSPLRSPPPARALVPSPLVPKSPFSRMLESGVIPDVKAVIASFKTAAQKASPHLFPDALAVPTTMVSPSPDADLSVAPGVGRQQQ